MAFVLFSSKASAQCNYSSVYTEDFEYSTNIPGVITGTIYHLAPQTYAAHTGAKGMYMNFVNGLSSNSLVYSKTHTVCANSTYRLSAWLKLSFGGSSTVTLRIKDANGVVLSTTTNTYPNGGAWTQYSSVITPTTTTIVFELIYISGYGGNDLGMDDIELELCNPIIPNGTINTCVIAPAFNLYDIITWPNDTIGVWSGPSVLNNGYLGTYNPASMDTGMYSYLITNAVAGCPDSTGTITVVLSNGPTVDLGGDTSLCLGDTLTLDGSYVNSSYLWSTGATSSVINVTSTGLYWVQVTDSCGMVSDTINVTFNPMPVVSLGADTLLCQGDSLVLDATNVNATYLWQDNTVDSVLTVTQTGVFWAEVTSNGCVSSDTISVTVNIIPVVNLGPDVTICQGDSVILNAAYPNSSYVWQDSTTNPIMVANLTGPYWVEVTRFNCFSSDTMILTVDTFPIVNLGADTILCNGDSLVLDAFNTNANYLWQNGSTNSELTVAVTGTYWVQVSNNSCVSSDTIFTAFNPVPIINLGNDTTLCDGDSILLYAGYSGATYLWQDNSTSVNYNVLTQGIYQVTVTLGTCNYSDSILVFYDPLPNVDLGNDTAVCDGESFLISLNFPTGTFIWQDASTKSYFRVKSAGTYWAQVTNNGCVNSDTIVVGSYPNPSVYIGKDTAICPSDSILLDATYPNATYMWNDNSTNATLYASAAGKYWVDVTNICGTVHDAIKISHVAIPTVDLGEDQTLCLDEWLDIHAEFPGASYLWQDSSKLSYYTVEEAGTYWVKVYNHCGFAMDTVLFEYEDCGCEFYIPNAFTPNGDDLNDYFLPKSNCEIWGYYFSVVDRWGMEVFETENPEIGWDGTFNGKPVSGSVFSYIIKYNYNKNGKQTPYSTLHGKVTVVR